MLTINELTEQLKQKAFDLGFSMVGVVAAEPGRRLDAYRRWLALERHGEMGYLARPDRLARRQDLNVILPGVRSLICVGLDYATLQLPDDIAGDPSRGRISNYAWGTDYHDLMTPRLEELAAWLQRQVAENPKPQVPNPKSQLTIDNSSSSPNPLIPAPSSPAVMSKVYVDTGAILERDHAESAGLGFTGKNSMLIAPRRGSWFFLGELLTTAVLTPDAPVQRIANSLSSPMPTCGSCHRCLDACPTHAFPEPYVLDARRCISYLTIELRGWLPRELRPLMGNWVYGCDICQVVCPFNRFARPSAEAAFWPANLAAAAPPLLELLALDEAAFAARFAGSPIKRIKRRGLLRNACVAAGNWGSPSAVPALSRLLADPEPILRGHAAWALRQIDNKEARAAVQQALANETDEQVKEELLN
jgi:epoxyqueuosine reductase